MFKSIRRKSVNSTTPNRHDCLSRSQKRKTEAISFASAMIEIQFLISFDDSKCEVARIIKAKQIHHAAEHWTVANAAPICWHVVEWREEKVGKQQDLQPEAGGSPGVRQVSVLPDRGVHGLGGLGWSREPLPTCVHHRRWEAQVFVATWHRKKVSTRDSFCKHVHGLRLTWKSYIYRF